MFLAVYVTAHVGMCFDRWSMRGLGAASVDGPEFATLAFATAIVAVAPGAVVIVVVPIVARADSDIRGMGLCTCMASVFDIHHS